SPRLVVVRTLSKAFGLAGLRLGWAVAAAETAGELEKTRGPYKVGGLAESAALAALTHDRAWVRERAAEIVALRARFAGELEKRALEGGLPCVGICLGMQLLFDASEEGEGEGLGLIAGKVTRLTARRTPHIGWTRVDGVSTEMYFAHSYACRPKDASVVSGWA